jgi:hypothetical protein
VTRRAAALVITLLLPLTLAASDPRNDAVPCLGTHGGGDPPDLVAAVGRVSEEGSAATWRLTFAEPLRVPDPADPPFRVDVVIRDPKVPAVAFGDYRDFNRIIRFDATRGDARLELLYITEGGHTLFDPPVIDGDTMTVGMPGRLLLGADEFGPTAMQRLRWTVVVRDGGRCDLLGAGGAPRLRLRVGPPASPSATPAAPPAPATSPAPGSGSATIGIAIAIVVVAGVGVAVFALLRRRR